MAAPEFPEQRFMPGFRTQRGVVGPIPPQMLEMPAVGWVLAQHAPGISVTVLQRGGGLPDLVGLLSYRGGDGDLAGMALIVPLNIDQARTHAGSILAACDRIEAGIDASDFPRRPAPPAEGR